MRNNKFIQQCFYPDFEKAIAVVGEERIWGGFKYKKIAQGRWVKVTEGKNKVSEREIKSTSLKKKLSQEIKERELEKQKFFQEIRKQWEEENGEIDSKITQRVAFDRYIYQIQPHKEFWDEIDLIIQDLNEEIDEILAFEKQERERVSGRKEIELDDDIFKNFDNQYKQEYKEFSKMESYISAKEALGEVSVNDYYLSTDANFKNYLNYLDVKEDDDLDKEWERMKKNPDLVHTKSPKSSSEYLVNHKTGDIYRYADHWDRCATCWWSYEGKSTLGIGVCNVKDFERNGSGPGYSNKKKISKGLEFCENQLRNIKELQEKVDFGKDVVKDIKNKIDRINRLLSSYDYEYLKESKKILEQYKEIMSL